MEHTIILKEEGYYNAFPSLDHLGDGRLVVGCTSSPFGDHLSLNPRPVLVSKDDGATWERSDDPILPPNWPGSTPREQSDRQSWIMPDGSFVGASTAGYELWDLERRAEAEARGLEAREHQHIPGKLLVRSYQLVVIRSRDEGHTWDRRTWIVPGYGYVYGLARGTALEDGTLLYPVYARRKDRSCDSLLFRSTDGGETWRLHPAFPRVGSEWAIVEVSPGRLLGHIRSGYDWGDPEHPLIYALEVWSEDGGLTWTYPVETQFQGYPNHLLRLKDGRILCTFGYRRKPMGVRALISEDEGRSWDLEHEYVLRDDAGTASRQWFPEDHGSGSPDVGYPLSTELTDGSILTVYYITTSDATTHVAATRWHPDRDRVEVSN